MTQDTDQYRAGFEAWARAKSLPIIRETTPFAGADGYEDAETHIAWTSWIAAKSEASTEPGALTACANCLRPKCEHNGKLCPAPYTTVWHAWDYKIQPMPTYKEYAAGALSDDAKDAARYRIIRSGSTGNDELTVATLFITGTELDEITDAAIEANKAGSLDA